MNLKLFLEMAVELSEENAKLHEEHRQIRELLPRLAQPTGIVEAVREALADAKISR